MRKISMNLTDEDEIIVRRAERLGVNLTSLVRYGIRLAIAQLEKERKNGTDLPEDDD